MPPFGADRKGSEAAHLHLVPGDAARGVTTSRREGTIGVIEGQTQVRLIVGFDAMFLSVFDIFKIGVGPSSSHTMGPMTAAARFLDDLRGGREKEPGAGELGGARLFAARLARLHRQGARDRPRGDPRPRGFEPATLDPDRAEVLEAEVRATGRVTPPGLPPLRFDPETDLVFDYGPPLPGHANGMILRAFDTAGNLYLEETYYSIGGGFVMTGRELERRPMAAPRRSTTKRPRPAIPIPSARRRDAADGAATGKTIAEMKWANETARHRDAEVAAAGRRLAGDGRLHRARPAHGGRVARRPEGEAPSPRPSTTTAGRARLEPRAAPYGQRLAQRLRHGGERGERGRRAGRDLAHQRRGGRGAGGAALLPRPLHRRDRGGAADLPADRPRRSAG
jgi:hypothetical protein